MTHRHQVHVAMLMVIKQNIVIIETTGLSVLPKDKQGLFLSRKTQAAP